MSRSLPHTHESLPQAVSAPQKVVAIVQPNYIPWKGYFDLIAAADEFILLEDVQYTRRDWRNRNVIKTAQGPQWLTIPVETKGKYYQSIRDTRVSDTSWPRRHWQAIQHSYARAAHFPEYRSWLEELFLATSEVWLSEVNLRFLLAVCETLGIGTRISRSSDYALVGGKTERLVSLCQQVGATTYLSGPAARAYLDEVVFDAAGIQVTYMSYDGYPEYPQLYPPFVHGVSIVDLILNVGPAAPRYMKYA